MPAIFVSAINLGFKNFIDIEFSDLNPKSKKKDFRVFFLVTLLSEQCFKSTAALA